MQHVRSWLSTRSRITAAPVLLGLAGLLTAGLIAGSAASATAQPSASPDRAGGHQVDTWTAAPTDLGGPYSDKTVRNIVHTSIGGSGLRVRLSNAFGSAPVTFDDVQVARQATGANVVAGSSRRASFGGSTSITIAKGAEVLSDPLPGTVAASSNLAVSLHVVGSSGEVTGHPDAQATVYYSDPVDVAGSPSAADYPYTIGSFFFVDGLVLDAPRQTSTVLTLGDSITDGYASTVDGNARWPDDLARRLLARHSAEQFSVANEGISANQVTTDASPQAGVSAQSRLDRDVLAQPGASTVIFLEGINDIGNATVTAASQLIAADQQIIARAHARGLRVIGGTLVPFQGAGYYSPQKEQVREDLNQWIRTGGGFDAVVDFDQAIRDPANPLVMLPAYDSGDHLHPNDAGYRAMANAVNLSALR